MLGQGAWTNKSDFGGSARYMAVAFSIGNKGYIGTGSILNISAFNDFWEYDPVTDVWTQKANVGIGSNLGFAVGFSIGTKGYIGTGIMNSNASQQFWEWDQATNVWTQKTSFGGISRWYATGFSIANKGYIGLGCSVSGNLPYNQDFWEYNPSTDTWTQVADFGGGPRMWAPGFSIGNKGYVGTGNNGAYCNDFWEYDPAMNMWIQKATYGGMPVNTAVGFSILNKGFIGTGVGGIPYNRNDFWEYDPATDAWIQIADFGGTGRAGSVGFSIGGKGYVGTGRDAVVGNTNDFWEFDPCKASVIGNTSICQGDSTVLTANSGVSYLWSTGDISQSITVYTAGNYTVTVSQSAPCGTTTTSNPISVNYITPAFNFTWNAYCQYDTVSFAPTVTCYNDTSWLWNFGDSLSGIENFSTLQFPSHYFTNVGIYDITLVLNGTDTTQNSIYITEVPVVNLGNDTTILSGDSILLDAGYVSWQFGNYLWSTGETWQTISVTDTGTYYVTVCEFGCCSSDTIHITLATGINNYENGVINVSFSPNIFSISAILQSTFLLENATLNIYNTNGNLVRQETELSGHSLIFQRNKLSSGLYLFSLIQNNKVLTTGKFIIIDY